MTHDDARSGNDAAAPPAAASGRVALDRMFEVVYPVLARIARSYMGRERSEHTLQATALVGETYLRLVRDRALGIHDHAHLVGLAARSMRQILVEHARARGAGKRGARAVHLTLSAALDVADVDRSDATLIALDEAVAELETANPRQAAIVQLRYFGGLSIDETAIAMDLSPATVKRDWTLARLWLLRSLERDRSLE